MLWACAQSTLGKQTALSPVSRASVLSSQWPCPASHTVLFVPQEDLLPGGVPVLWGALESYRGAGCQWRHHCTQTQRQHPGEGELQVILSSGLGGFHRSSGQNMMQIILDSLLLQSSECKLSLWQPESRWGGKRSPRALWQPQHPCCVRSPLGAAPSGFHTGICLVLSGFLLSGMQHKWPSRQ